MAAAPTMRVLHVIDSLGLGGAQTMLKAYVESGAAAEELHVFALRSTPSQLELRAASVEVADSGSRFSPAPLLRLRRIARARGIDVLHCHLFRSQVFGFLAKLFLLPGVKLVLHEHGRVLGRERESRLEQLAFHAFLKASAPFVNLYVCNSELTRERLTQIVPAATPKAIALPPPIRAARASEGLAAVRARIPAGSFVIGFAARLVENKGWREFLQAAAALRKRIPLHFLLAGEGAERSEANELVDRLGLREAGQMLGYIDDMDAFYGLLDCFVLPTHWEGHGLSHLEAQSHGVPVVVSDATGLASSVHPEVDALVHRVGDADGLAAQVCRLHADDALRARLAEAGRLNAAKYSASAFAERLSQAYPGAAPGPAPALHAAIRPDKTETT